VRLRPASLRSRLRHVCSAHVSTPAYSHGNAVGSATFAPPAGGTARIRRLRRRAIRMNAWGGGPRSCARWRRGDPVHGRLPPAGASFRQLRPSRACPVRLRAQGDFVPATRRTASPEMHSRATLLDGPLLEPMAVQQSRSPERITRRELLRKLLRLDIKGDGSRRLPFVNCRSSSFGRLIACGGMAFA
jgi:hypothetical protein